MFASRARQVLLEAIGEEPLDATHHVCNIDSVLFSEVTVVGVVTHGDPDLNLSQSIFQNRGGQIRGGVFVTILVQGLGHLKEVRENFGGD
jgi:hypothetical protein